MLLYPQACVCVFLSMLLCWLFPLSLLECSCACVQGSDRIALVDSQPWSAQVLLWRVLPVSEEGFASAAAGLGEGWGGMLVVPTTPPF